MAVQIDDMSAASLPEPWKQRLAHLKYSTEIELHQPLPLLQGHLCQGACIGNAGIVNYNSRCEASAAEVFQSGSNSGRLGEIEADGFDSPASGL